MNGSQVIELFYEFISKNLHAELLESSRREEDCLKIDFSELSKFNIDLAEELLSTPEEVIKAADLAVEKFDAPKKIHVRFFNLPESCALKISDIRSKHLGKFVKMKGTIRTKTEVRPQVVAAKFECPSCGNVISISQTDNTFQKPNKCACGRKGKFKLIEKTLIDAQKITLEESHDEIEGGAQPKRMDVFLKEDLASPWTDRRRNPGTKVVVYGFIKEVPVFLKSGSQSITFQLMLMGNYVEPTEEDFLDIKIDDKELEEIKKLADGEDVYEKLILSIAPSIYGHEKVKEALVLQMFGGVRKIRDDGVVTRGDTHILLIGDPGSGKSQLIQRMSVVAPKSRFVSGKGVSGAGLTASVIRDEFTQGWALEAGALVLANKGYCMIDEMDKMNKEDRDAMHEALEQQTVSISKANIQATLRCQTTVLAAANPKYGRFDPYGTIAEQIDLPPSLINRFDLIFPIKDLPNKEKDSKMSSFILKLHQTATVEKLNAPIKTELLRKYIAYAKQNMFPKLTDDAIKKIQEYYVKMRNSGGGDEGIRAVPISARQLEGIIRLAEASAKVKLKKTVDVDDADRAINLVQYCLSEIAMDKETGKIDIDKLSSGITAAARGKIIGIREIINELAEKIGKDIPVADIVREAEAKGISADKVEDALEKLKRSGDIFEPRTGIIHKL